eukprot:scaffold2339_cov368-Prasinococcus_capsulatus_cf.AAC.6
MEEQAYLHYVNFLIVCEASAVQRYTVLEPHLHSQGAAQGLSGPARAAEVPVLWLFTSIPDESSLTRPLEGRESSPHLPILCAERKHILQGEELVERNSVFHDRLIQQFRLGDPETVQLIDTELLGADGDSIQGHVADAVTWRPQCPASQAQGAGARRGADTGHRAKGCSGDEDARGARHKYEPDRYQSWRPAACRRRRRRCRWPRRRLRQLRDGRGATPLGAPATQRAALAGHVVAGRRAGPDNQFWNALYYIFWNYWPARWGRGGRAPCRGSASLALAPWSWSRRRTAPPRLPFPYGLRTCGAPAGSVVASGAMCTTGGSLAQGPPCDRFPGGQPELQCTSAKAQHIGSTAAERYERDAPSPVADALHEAPVPFLLVDLVSELDASHRTSTREVIIIHHAHPIAIQCRLPKLKQRQTPVAPGS